MRRAYSNGKVKCKIVKKKITRFKGFVIKFYRDLKDVCGGGLVIYLFPSSRHSKFLRTSARVLGTFVQINYTNITFESRYKLNEITLRVRTMRV